MVVKYQEPAEAFAYRNGHGKSGNMFATADAAYSYAECIARWTDQGVEINTNRYSVTTSAHQGAIRRAIKARGFSPDPVQPDDLDDGWVLYTCLPIYSERTK